MQKCLFHIFLLKIFGDFMYNLILKEMIKNKNEMKYLLNKSIDIFSETLMLYLLWLEFKLDLSYSKIVDMGRLSEVISHSWCKLQDGHAAVHRVMSQGLAHASDSIQIYLHLSLFNHIYSSLIIDKLILLCT